VYRWGPQTRHRRKLGEHQIRDQRLASRASTAAVAVSACPAPGRHAGS
jgi:hypothetical protein